ncbi:hypothetical protein A0U92_11300 [Acetobacter aceti]|uniref:Uncharacterized protein n=1 Tax=Acetobacter aceti TaxID=435 RepID=A0A1U9KHI6_ACEAC|nr:hypothetical protein A0U92_11300 [Acetobacter aceti]
MSHDCALHASSSLNGLARKAAHSPKLLTREEIVLLFEHATEQGKGILPSGRLSDPEWTAFSWCAVNSRIVFLSDFSHEKSRHCRFFDGF